MTARRSRLELVEHRLRRVALGHALGDLVVGEVAEAPQDDLELVAVDRLGLLDAVLEGVLDVGERDRVDQLAELLLAEQLAEQVAVEGERGGAALGVRRVALVHVGRDVVEEQRGGERRGGLRLDLDQRQPPRLQVAEDLAERRQVEDVAEDLAVGLERDREAREVAGDLEQRLRLQPLLPERGALAGVGARDQQRPAGRLAEAGAEQRRARELADDQVLDLVGLEQDEVGGRRLIGVGKVDDDAVVGPDRVGLELELGADLRREREAPGGVDATAERREHAEPPVADLVAEALDDDRLVGGDDPGRGLLLAQVGDEVLGGELVEVVVGGELLGLGGDGLARELADRPAELDRAADPLAAPERDRAGDAGGRGDDHPVAGDLLDPPRGRTEQEDLAGAGLVDHLLVELADAPSVGEVDAEEPAVGDRAGVGDRELARALAPADGSGGPVPDDPRAKLGEALGRVAAVEHVEDVLELLAGQLAVGLGGLDDALDLVDLPVLVGDHRDDLLGEDVERVLRDHRLLDLAGPHPLGDDRALEQVGAELREDPALRDGPELVAGAADPLHPARHRLRRLDLDHEVDRAHVDPELERRGRDDARELPGLEQLLDLEALLAGERAVMGAGDLLVLAGGGGGALAAGPAGGSPTVRGISPRWPSVTASAPLPAFISFRRFASRSAPRRLLTKMIVEVCSRTSFSSSG